MSKVIGIDLGGTKVNVTAFDGEKFVIPEMLEVSSDVSEGPEACIERIKHVYDLALEAACWEDDEVEAIGLDTPGPASADGVLSAQGTTNFNHSGYSRFDIRASVSERIGKPAHYLNDGNAAALYAHWNTHSHHPKMSSVSLIIGTGLGGGIVIAGKVVIGRTGFAAELGHVRLPKDWHPTLNLRAECNCGRLNDLESIASLTGIKKNLLPYFLSQNPSHPLSELPIEEAAKQVRQYAIDGDEMAKEIFDIQTYAIASHIDQLINIFDMDSVFIGGGGVEGPEEFSTPFLQSIKERTPLLEEQKDLDISLIPDGDMAGARGAALFAAQVAVTTRG